MQFKCIHKKIITNVSVIFLRGLLLKYVFWANNIRAFLFIVVLKPNIQRTLLQKVTTIKRDIADTMAKEVETKKVIIAMTATTPRMIPALRVPKAAASKTTDISPKATAQRANTTSTN